MTTRRCPHCHRRIVATESLCCYCRRDSEAEDDQGVVVALDGTPVRGVGVGTSETAGQVAVVGSDPPLTEAGTTTLSTTPGSGLSTNPGARQSLTFICTVCALYFVATLIPVTRPVLDPVRTVLAVVVQFWIVCRPFEEWSVRLLFAAALIVWIDRRPPARFDDPGYQLHLLLLFASLQATIIGVWRSWRYHPPDPPTEPDRPPDEARAAHRSPLIHSDDDPSRDARRSHR